MPMTDAEIATAIENQETFVCAWCYEAEPDLPEEYTCGYDRLGGHDDETGRPICDFCADAAQEFADYTEAI